MTLYRRQFATSCLGASLLPTLTLAQAPQKKIAFLGTSVYQHSHAQHFLDRFAAGYAMGGKWNSPVVELAGVYIDQIHAKDISKQRIAKYGLREFKSIAETLTLGGDKLAVDGVILIGEHGEYPSNEKGQKLYPRYRWFKEIVKVFEASGRSVPVFNDKHLSTEWGECQSMFDDAKRLQFPFYAGSSLPVTWRLPSFELPIDTPLQESVCVAYGGVDSYDFHALETAQCISERRRGGEIGIRAVQALKGESMWDELAKRDLTRKLFVSALCRSHHLPVDSGYPDSPVSFEWARRVLPNTIGYFIEHRDGFQTSIFLTGIRDFNYAGYRSDTNEIVGCQMMLPMPGSSATTADFFNPLTRHVEQMIIDNKTAYPIERTLLTSGMVIAAVDSLFSGGRKIETPEMAVAYRAPHVSMYWQM
jgi:hypothetical protein